MDEGIIKPEISIKKDEMYSFFNHMFNTRSIKRFSKKEIWILEHGNQSDLAQLILDYNILIKRIENHYKQGWYVWNPECKLWILKGNEFPDAIAETLLQISHRAYEQNQIDMKQHNQIRNKLKSTSYPSTIIPFLKSQIQPDLEFTRLLDAHPTRFPIASNCVIDARTLNVRKRQSNDYFSKAYQWSYLPYLRNNDNVFHKFICSMWENQNIIDYFTMICGHMILPDENSQNVLVLWKQKRGGGGKSVFLTVFEQLWGPITAHLEKSTLFKGDKQKFELSKCIGKRCVYADEAVPDGKDLPTTIDSNKLDISTILHLTGGGKLTYTDKHQAHDEISPVQMIHTLLLCYNGRLFQNDHVTAPMKRRLICFKQLIWFRDKTKTIKEIDEFCRQMQPNIKVILMNNINQCFTWFINAAHYYLTKQSYVKWHQPNKSFHVKTFMPDIIQKYTKEVMENNIPEEFAVIQEYMDKYTIFIKGATVSLDEMIPQLNRYVMHIRRFDYSYNTAKIKHWTQKYSIKKNNMHIPIQNTIQNIKLIEIPDSLDNDSL